MWGKIRTEFNSDSFSYEMLADCCHSGGWVHELQSHPYKCDPHGIRYRDVHMIASCGKYEICTDSKIGGTFTDHSDSSTHNLNDTVEHIAKLSAPSVFQALAFPLYIPIKGITGWSWMLGGQVFHN